MAMNKVFITGRLTKNPEPKQTKTGVSVTTFSVASDKRASKNNPEPGTNFFDCVAWGSRGETISKYFVKGNPILIEGRLDYQTWEKDGMKRSKIIIVVDDFQFMESAKSSGKTGTNIDRIKSQSQPFGQAYQQSNNDEITQDMIPF